VRLTAPGEEPRIPLRYRLDPGTTQAFRSRLRLGHQGEGQAALYTLVLDWERTLGAAQADRVPATLAIRRVVMVRPESIAEAVTRKLEDLTLTTTLDPRGRATSLTGGPSLPGGEALARLTAPLPEAAVGEGATWERYEPVDLPLPRLAGTLRLGLRATYTARFKRVKGKPSTVTVTGKLRLLTTQPEAEGMAPATRLSGDGNGTSSMRLHLGSGTVQESTAELTMTLTVESAGRQHGLTQTTSISTRPVKRTR
jgi:hypothetical protein